MPGRMDSVTGVSSVRSDVTVVDRLNAFHAQLAEENTRLRAVLARAADLVPKVQFVDEHGGYKVSLPHLNLLLALLVEEEMNADS